MAKAKTGYKIKYKPEFPFMLTQHMESGLSFESFGAIADVSRQALYDWVEKYPEFKDAKDRGELKSRLFWEKLGRSGAVGKIENFQASVWIFTMKCRFGFRDGSESGDQAESKPLKDIVYKTKWGNK